jgi:hypothetical protein
MFEELKKFLDGNEDGLKLVATLEENQSTLTKKLNKLEVDSAKAFQTRDELKQKLGLVKSKLGLDEIDEEALTKALKGKTDDAELNNLKALLDKANKEKSDVESEYKSKLSNFALKSELQKTGLAQKSLNQDVYEILESIALKGATYSDDGSIAYKNEDGSTKYHNGKPLTLADKVAELEQSEAYKPLFKAVGVGGTGANPNPNSGSGMQNNGDFIP